MVDEKNTIQVVDFVLDDTGEAISGFDADIGAVFKQGFDAGFGVAGNETVDVGDREATFVVFGLLAFVFDDFWVDQGDEIGIFLVVHVFADDDDAFVVAELGSGHGGGEFEFVGFFPIFGGFAHPRNDVSDFWGDLTDFGGFFAEFWVWGS